MELPRGSLFNRYRIEEAIGEGGMGRVYRAFDTRLGRMVSLKVLRASDNAEHDARLQREARAAAALNHPNAVSIFDVGESVLGDERVRFIAMELIDGRDLRSLSLDPNVPSIQRIRWLADVARALAAAHRAGLVHRDVKPENAMVRSDGVVKVLDFGLARRLTPGDEGEPAAASPRAATQPLATVTERGIVVGTPVYMSPEQLRGDAVDGRADQFAWAVMAYELLAGRLPWKNTGEPVHLIAEESSPSIRCPSPSSRPTSRR